MRQAIFEQSTLEQVGFYASTLTESDWYAVKQQALTFERCELTDARFEETKLHGIDLSTSQFHALHVAKEHAQNCTIAAVHAPIFLAIYGIDVK